LFFWFGGFAFMASLALTALHLLLACFLKRCFCPSNGRFKRLIGLFQTAIALLFNRLRGYDPFIVTRTSFGSPGCPALLGKQKSPS
jgi:hypothetical protein